MLRIAGTVGITPSEFWRITPYEFRLYCEGYGNRDEQDTWRAAFISANVMNLFSKRTIKPEMLLGKKEGNANAAFFTDAESFRAHMRERNMQLEAKAHGRT